MFMTSADFEQCCDRGLCKCY